MNQLNLSADEYAAAEHQRREQNTEESRAWSHLPHGSIEHLAPNLWRVEGSLPNMDLKRTMVIVRLADGGLVLHSAVAMEEDQMEEMEKLGTPKFLVVPNGWHAHDASRYQLRYPEAKLLCPPKAKDMLNRKGVKVDGTYEHFPMLDDHGTVRLDLFEPERHMEGCMVVRSDDGITLVFGDSLFNLPHKDGFWWFVYGRIMGSTGGPKVTRISRFMMFLTRSKCYFRDYLQGWAADDLVGKEAVVRIVPGHGDVIDKEIPKVLEEIAGSLMENAVGWFERQTGRVHAAELA